MAKRAFNSVLSLFGGGSNLLPPPATTPPGVPRRAATPGAGSRGPRSTAERDRNRAASVDISRRTATRPFNTTATTVEMPWDAFTPDQYDAINNLMTTASANMSSPGQLHQDEYLINLIVRLQQNMGTSFSLISRRLPALSAALEDVDEAFFTAVIPFMVRCCMHAKEIFGGQSIPILRDHGDVFACSPKQACVLVCLCFFGLMPMRHKLQSGADPQLPYVNFTNLFAMSEGCAVEKLLCFFEYFTICQELEAVGRLSDKPRIEIERNSVRHQRFPFTIPRECMSKISYVIDTTIEDNHGTLQVDFANKLVGGGVLGRGSVQEEIRFSICPELLVARIVTRELQDGEAVAVRGAAQFTYYEGYASTFRFAGRASVEYIRYRDVVVTLIDAMDFSCEPPSFQFTETSIMREFHKAYAGFSTSLGRECTTVATGRWGCGAFAGDDTLKLLIQWCACSAAHKEEMAFHTTTAAVSKRLKDQLNKLVDEHGKAVTFSLVLRAIIDFGKATAPSRPLADFVIEHVKLRITSRPKPPPSRPVIMVDTSHEELRGPVRKTVRAPTALPNPCTLLPSTTRPSVNKNHIPSHHPIYDL